MAATVDALDDRECKSFSKDLTVEASVIRGDMPDFTVVGSAAPKILVEKLDEGGFVNVALFGPILDELYSRKPQIKLSCDGNNLLVQVAILKSKYDGPIRQDELWRQKIIIKFQPSAVGYLVRTKWTAYFEGGDVAESWSEKELSLKHSPN